MSQAAVLDAPREIPRIAPAGYFQKSGPTALILSAFFVFTLPLAYLAWAHPDSPEFLRLELLYLCGLGVTHFVITPVIYLQSSNLRFFASNWRNRLIYFAIPIAIFVGLYVPAWRSARPACPRIHPDADLIITLPAIVAQFSFC